MRYFLKVFESLYCKITFIFSLLLSYFLLPRTVFFGWYLVLAVAFMLVFALTMTCIVRNIKEKIVLAKTYKSSILAIIATALGLSALQVCGIGGVCGFAFGFGILSLILPATALKVLTDFAIYFVIFSILLQLIALYYMNCFKKEISFGL